MRLSIFVRIKLVVDLISHVTVTKFQVLKYANAMENSDYSGAFSKIGSSATSFGTNSNHGGTNGNGNNNNNNAATSSDDQYPACLNESYCKKVIKYAHKRLEKSDILDRLPLDKVKPSHVQHDDFHLGELLGEGSFSAVYDVTIKSESKLSTRLVQLYQREEKLITCSLG